MNRYALYIIISLLTFGLGSAFVIYILSNQSTKDVNMSKVETQFKTPIKAEFPKPIEDNYEKVAEKLDIYLSGHEIEPYIEINNISGTQKKIKVGRHKIYWIDKDKDNIKLKINDDLFRISKYTTLNKVWGGKDKVEYFNEWKQIKLFKVDGKELIGIKFYFYMCNGLGCHVSYYLIYDVETKGKNFFGAYCMDDSLKIYDFNRDNKIDYLGKTYVGNRCSEPDQDSESIYTLFTLDGKGKFLLQNDKQQKPYFIKQKFWAEGYKKNDEIFEQNWTENIYIGE
ncbi:MAG: hypothetical protein M3405_08925 [Acidobacteriota bacterium]|nr:hypothetical protein [Acidobacteriota bacterium]